MLLNSHRFVVAVGGNPELLPDPELNDATKWSIGAGFTFTGGNVDIDTTGLASFGRLQNAAPTNRAAVAPSTGYTLKATLNSVTTAGRVRIIINQFTAAFDASGGTSATTVLYDTNVSGPLTAGTITTTFTSAATTNSVGYIFESTTVPLVAQLASLSLKAT